MKAAVLRGVGKPLTIEEVQIANPRSHEVLVRTAAVGVCHSDLHYIEGLYSAPMPAVLGHEAAGVVEKVALATSQGVPIMLPSFTVNSTTTSDSETSGRR